MANLSLIFVSFLAFILIIIVPEGGEGFFLCPSQLCQSVSLCGDLEQARANAFLQNSWAWAKIS